MGRRRLFLRGGVVTSPVEGPITQAPPSAPPRPPDPPGSTFPYSPTLARMAEQERRIDAVRAMCVSRIPSPERQAAGLDAYTRGEANACLEVLALLSGERASDT